MFCYKISKVIASYFVPLQCIPDAIVFTAGIGERSPLKRKIIVQNLAPFGIQIDDEESNEKNDLILSQGRVKILVIPTNEELVIAQETCEIVSKIQ